MGDNAIEDGADAALEAVRQCMIQINEWIPVLGDFLEMITQWPEARHDRLFDLADSYLRAAELYRDHLDELQDYLPDLDAWQGDGAAQVMRAELQAYFDETAGMAELLGAVQQTVHAKALEIETMKWMAVVTLVMMAVALIQAIITIWTGVGGAAGLVAIATARAGIQRLAQQLLTRLWQETVKAGVRRFTQNLAKNVGRAALRGGLAYAGVMGGIKGGILLLQAAEGHDPFTEGWATRFGVELVDSFIAGAIGGPLTMGIHSRIVEAGAFGIGQTVDNVLQYGRDRALDAAGLQDWAQRNHLYSGMTLDNLLDSVTPAALLGEILSETGKRGRPLDLVTPAVNQGALNLFGNSGANAPTPSNLAGPTSLADPAALPAVDPAALPDGTPAPAPVGAPNTSGGGAGTSTGTSGGGAGTSTGTTGTRGAAAPSSGVSSAPSTSSASGTGSATGPGNAPSTGTAAGGGATGTSRAGAGTPSGAGSSPTAPDPTTTTSEPTTSGPSPGEPVVADADPSRSAVASTVGGDDTPAATTTPERAGDGTAYQPTADDSVGESTHRGGTPTPTHPETSASVDGSAADHRSHDGATAGAPSGQPDAGRSDPARPDRARPDPAQGTRADPARAEPAAAVTDRAGDGNAGRDEPRWRDWRQRIEQRIEAQYAQGVGEHFTTSSDGSAGSVGRPAPQLTPDMVQQALNTRPETLNRYGARLRSFVEQNFTRVDETGARRALDQTEIAARLEQLRAEASSPTPSTTPTSTPEPDAPTTDTPDATRTPDGASPPEAGSRPDGVSRPDDGVAPERGEGGSGETPERRGYGVVPGTGVRAEPGHTVVEPELQPSTNLGPNFPSAHGRTGADLPRQVHDLVDRARQQLLSRYPEHAVAGRVRDLDEVARIADRLPAAADRARSTNEMRDLVQQVRELSRAVTEYSDRYRNWHPPNRPDLRADPGWRDLDGVDPLNSVEMANRIMGIDPETHRFHVIDQAIAIAKIGEVLGPEFETHAIRTFQRTIPMDLQHARHLLSPADLSRLEESLTGDSLAFYDPILGATFVNPNGAARNPLTAQDARYPRPISAIATTIVHEGMHALQPNNALLGQLIVRAVPEDDFRHVVNLLRLEREFQGFAVQQRFLQGLAGFRSSEPQSDVRIPETDRYRVRAADSPQQLIDHICTEYGIPRESIPDDVLARLSSITPESIVEHARAAILESTHPDPSQRRHGNLFGPITQQVVDAYGLDLDGLRQRQGDLSFPPLRDEGAAPQPDSGQQPDGERRLEQERGAGGIDPSRRQHLAPDTFGPLHPEQPGPLGERFTPGVHDRYDGTPQGFDDKERATANLRAGEGRLVTRLPVHPLNHEGYRSLEALERTGPDDPGRAVEYKDVGDDTRRAMDHQLKRGIDKFGLQPDGTRLEGDVVIDGRRGDLSLDNAVNSLRSRVGRLLAEGDPRLAQVGRIDVYLGDGSRVGYANGRITHVTARGERVVGDWDAGAGRFVEPPPPDAHSASPIPDTGFVPEGRPDHLSDVSPAEFQHAVARVLPDDFDGGSVVSVRPDGRLVRVETADGRVHHFQPDVDYGMRNVAETTMRAGTVTDPHVVRVNHRVAPEQLARTWVHEISETVQHRAAARRAEPQGVVRRMLDGLRRLFGGEPRTRPPVPDTDPHVAARLDERRHLVREFDGARTGEERARLRSEIEGIDRDLARLGHPGRDLPPAPEVNQPIAEPAPPPESSHDEIWRDPPWRRDGRPPSVDELIPSTDAEIARWEGAIREELAHLLDGREFAGMRVRFDPTDPDSVSAYRNVLVVRAMTVGAGGSGNIVYEFRREADGRLVVKHVVLNVASSAHGRGFAREFNQFMEEWYRYSGVREIRLRASGTVGGYAWARAGYQWLAGSEHWADRVLDRLRTQLRALNEDAAQVSRWMAGDSTVDIDALRRRYGAEDPDALLAEMQRQEQGAQEILDRAGRNLFGGPDYPSPYEISQAGWNGQRGRDASWIGKRAMIGAVWEAVRPISDGGPLHPRSAHAARVPPLEPPPVPPATADPATPPTAPTPRGDDFWPPDVEGGRHSDWLIEEERGPRSAAGVPFDFERFLTDPRWADDAIRFEQRLGAHYFNDPHTVDAARTAVARLRDVLMAFTARHAGESAAAFARRVESAFFRDDVADSAGQVGTGVSIDALLADGNLRELMTAFYNAAYFNRDAPQTLTSAVLDIVDNGRWDQARAHGLDVDELDRMRRQLDESVNRAVLGRLEEWFDPTGLRFARDPFGTGNVVMLFERGLRDLADVVQSQAGRHNRTPEEQERLGLITTPGHYEGLGVPLGRFERAYLESVIGVPLTADTPLTWREGVTAHGTTGSRWARRVTAGGFPVVDGVSATTTRMLTAAKFLGLARQKIDRFLGALMGWMLPGRDHSLFEIIRGAQIAGFGRLELESGRFTAVDLYRSLPGLDLRVLRAEILPDGLFPHEARYLDHATDPDGFSETRHPKVREIADRLWPQLRTGHVTDPALADWLGRTGIDPSDADAVRALGEWLSQPHVMALTVYTRHSHYLINNVTRTQLWTGGVSEAAVRSRMAERAGRLVEEYLKNLAAGTKALPLPLALRPLLHVGEGHLDSRSELHPRARAWIDASRRAAEAARRAEAHEAAGRHAEARQAKAEDRAARRARKAAWRDIEAGLAAATPRLFDEMRWHADMVHDAMLQLPALGSPDRPVTAYRGDWMTPIHSPIYGSRWSPHGTAREFLSVSRLLEVAVRFMSENPASDRKVLVVYRLTGGQARDISVFSSFAEDQEAVFPPRSRMRRVDDPELVARVRNELTRTAEDMVRRGVLPETPRRYEILVMEEE